jgi:serine/alanine racemase
MEGLLIENSMVHYLAVTVSSVAVSFLFLIIVNIKKRNIKKSEIGEDRAWLEINLNNIEHNSRVLKGLLPQKGELMAVVKADAYGHGAVVVSQYLNKAGINSFAVATIEEGIELRKHGVRGDILILGYTELVRAKDLKKYKLMQTIVDYRYAKAVNECGQKLKVHIKIDTGMHRLGVDSNHLNEVIDIIQMEYLDTCGIFTHLCVSDSHDKRDVAFTMDQIANFYDLIEALKEKNIPIPKLHIQSSYGLLNYPELNCDYVRMGIALYGTISSLGDTTKVMPDLRPALSLKAHIALIRNIKAGESVGYGRAFTAERDSCIAVIPIGYADGLPRNLSCNKVYALLHGQRVPIIGRICMDQLVIDITCVVEARSGDTVTLIGKDGEEEITAVELAKASNSITNELLSRLGHRLHKVYHR